ncbi:hypothetical protein CH252_33145 [Rhodococcus sp. 06-1477-1B]|nr:hypothetical protein CH252_33145 [Rhodococcus sp. 06-1477-1B]
MSSLAVRQLQDLAGVSAGAIEYLGAVDGEMGVFLSVSLDTSGIVTSGSGIRVRARERFEIFVEPSYPHSYPHVLVRHRRWADTPHVQWGSSLCLYAAPSVEWVPGDGMRGLVERLMSWLARAAEGQLDPAGQPLHPPVAYARYVHGSLVVRPDLGTLVPWSSPMGPRADVLYAWCVHRGSRVDVLEWLPVLEMIERVTADDVQTHDEAGNSYFVVPVALVSDTLNMEYPQDAVKLARALETYGLSQDDLFLALVRTATANRALGHETVGEDAVPSILMLGTPARRLEPGKPLAHLSAWHLDELGAKLTRLLRGMLRAEEEVPADILQLAQDWISIAKVRWMVVHEARDEVTRRRDEGSASTWLTGKKVLLLGAGALGAPLAEQLVRAGVSGLHVIDKGTVGPGVLVRQPYDDADIGYNKARRLVRRLDKIRAGFSATWSRGDVVSGILQAPEEVLRYDLVIDATADVGVRTALEATRARNRDAWPATIGGVFGHTAERGIVTVALPGATGATHDILRRTAIETSTNPPTGWADFADDFFPKKPRTDLFFPEPGCSAPTFTGSSTQTVALASLVLWSALQVLTDATSAPMTATAVSLTPNSAGHFPAVLNWENDLVVPDDAGVYEVRIAAGALTEMRAEARRGCRVRGPGIETGGMLLGMVDEAISTIYVDSATGPPPDSHLSAIYFDHGVDGTQATVSRSLTNTGDRVGFVGMWHTHPNGRAAPSEIDESGMSQIVSSAGMGRRALMLILGGERAWNDWVEPSRSGTTPPVPDVYARVVTRVLAVTPPPRSGYYLTVGETEWHPGGYGYRSAAQQSGTGKRA